MEWEFTPEQVVKGEIGYSLEEFRNDLHQEVRLNLPEEIIDGSETEKGFNLVYDLCYWMATGRDFEEFEAQFESGSFIRPFLRMVREHSASNIEMLGAILQRLIMDGVESGMPVEQAVAAVAKYHEEVAAKYLSLNA